MKEVILGISFQEYYLTIIRVCVFLNTLGEEHKKNTAEERLVLYDFYLRFPELFIENEERADFDTQYSYFHWKPNYRLYSAILAELRSRQLIVFDKERGSYSISALGSEFVTEMKNSYTNSTVLSSEYVMKKICGLSAKKISEDINDKLKKKRGFA